MAKNAKGDKIKPEIVVLYCKNCLAKDAEPIAFSDTDNFTARLVMMPCSSKVEVSHLLKILAEGADGVEVVGCPENQCRFLVGNVRAEKRVEYARQLLDKVRMGMDRLGMDRGENMAISQLVSLAGKRADAVKSLGPNPMKG